MRMASWRPADQRHAHECQKRNLKPQKYSPCRQGERRTRGTAFYPRASLVNHECLPNVARVDDFDTTGPSNMAMRLVALHNIPMGEEVTQSYFPLTWDYEARQQQCQQQYGFECSCPRCLVLAPLTNIALLVNSWMLI